MSSGGHKYSQVGSEVKLCPVKLAFLFHMMDFKSQTEICSMAVMRARKSIVFNR